MFLKSLNLRCIFMTKYSSVTLTCFAVVQSIASLGFAENSFILHEKSFKDNSSHAALFSERENLLADNTQAFIKETSSQDNAHFLSLEETLYLRRISSYWKEKNYTSAKNEILAFFNLFPTSSVKDPLSAMLGDLYFHEKNYKEALTAYEQIGSEDYQERAFLNMLRSQFELKEYGKVSKNGTAYLTNKLNIDKNKENQIDFLCAEAFLAQAKEGKDTETNTLSARNAKTHYEKLKGSKYEEATFYPLAQTNMILQDYPAAVTCYLKLQEKFPDKQEDLLFQVAQLQLKYNVEEAGTTFGKLCQLKGKKASLAAYNLLTLLFDSKNYAKILELKEQLLPLVADHQKAVAEWYIGWSHYILQDFTKAAPYIEHFASLETKENPQFKTALLSLMNCAENQKNLPLFDKTLDLFRRYYNNDPMLAKALMLHAQVCSESNALAQGIEDLKEIMLRFPDAANIEEAKYNYALLLCQNNQWGESREAFISFLHTYPKTENKTACYRHILYNSIKEVKNAPGAEAQEKKTLFCKDLEWVLKQPDVLNPKEKNEYSFVHVKTLYELNAYEKAAEKLAEYFEGSPEFNSLAEAHILMALCQKKLFGVNDQFVLHTEKALELNPQISGYETLHLQLFNVYLSFANADKEKSQELLEKGANHLHQVCLSSTLAIKPENREWLANFYHSAFKNTGSIDARDKAIYHFETILGMHNTDKAASLKEVEALRLAGLYEQASQIDKQIALLTQLKDLQQTQADGNWKYQRQTLFELAKAYENKQELEKALMLYKELAQLKVGSSFISQAALLREARLKFALLPESERNESSEECLSVLSMLKDLTLAKQLPTEPLHVEAALDYAQILSSLSEARTDNYLTQLKRIKEEFSSQDTPFANDYYSKAKEYPEKESLIKSYLLYVDAEILRNEALVRQKEGNLEEVATFQTKALTQLESLLQDPSLPEDLKLRVEKSMESLK